VEEKEPAQRLVHVEWSILATWSEGRLHNVETGMHATGGGSMASHPLAILISGKKN
jgi:hypothetical protein